MINTTLKNMLRKVRSVRLINYGISAYQSQTHDYYLENVPIKLTEIWYGQGSLSFPTLSITHNSDIDTMSNLEILCRIEKEYRLLTRLKRIFSALQNRK